MLSADVKRVDGQFRVFAKGGREDTGRDALDWISWCVDHGAGEICLNSIDTDGVRSGFDLEMLDAVAARVNVPIIASGGAGKVVTPVKGFDAVCDFFGQDEYNTLSTHRKGVLNGPAR